MAIFSSLICLAACIWRAEAKTYGSFMGATVLNGFGAGPAETLPREQAPVLRLVPVADML